MNISQIEEVVKKLVVDVNAGSVNKDEFVYQLMAAYGHRKTTIGRIKSGERNLADVTGEVRAKRHVYFKHCQGNNVLSDIDSMKKQPSVTREKIRFVIATDFNQFVALDTRTNDTLDIEFNDLGKHFDFFLPWAGMEKAVYQGENPADVKAAEKMARLFDLIKADNFNDDNKHDKQALHNLNVFLTRLLFCFFAEDTGIFKQNQFSGELESHTKVDGSDVAEYLNRLFEVLNTPKDKRADLPDYLANFEFVNGGLFADNIQSPRFSTKSRKMLIESGSELDWSDINPDIFGSMIQAVVHPDQRGGMGMHYTSVTNIMKVIEPLFLDELYAELENIEDNIDPKLKPSRLRKLHDRIAEIKVFDPACGSGNFLIIAFKELRKLEMEIIKRLQELGKNDNQDDLFGAVGLDSSFSRIKLSQFYGIELDDFAHEVAILSLWLAEHQMNVEFKAEFGECEPSLPLKQGGNIVNNNAATFDWATFIGPTESEVFVLGNPPYLGARQQSQAQKSDMKHVFGNVKGLNDLDYISIWFVKASRLLGKFSKLHAAFVSTNSISQGVQVATLWPHVFKNGADISFAYESFKWTNNAKKQAGVICVIIGIKGKGNFPKYLFNNDFRYKVSNINPYLREGENVFVQQRKRPISLQLPEINYGSFALDDGNYTLDKDEYLSLISENDLTKESIREFIGARELLQGHKRYCLWLSPETDYSLSPSINNRIDKVRKWRFESSRKATQKLAETAELFAEIRQPDVEYLAFPTISSERREYIPSKYFDSKVIASNQIYVVPNAPLWLFAILSSSMHMSWIKNIGGRLKSDYRYSSSLCYNTFPVPKLNESHKEKLSEYAINILSSRESYSDRTLAKLYDPELMPDDLRHSHKELDSYIEAIYRQECKSKSTDHLSLLLEIYSKLTGGQNA
ncbi:hypothetical protein L1266_20585 [Pseudoalteromonas sp. Cn5-37]|uniref:DNA methyltransferase n=1 Tax=Pseudoalteromonas sp. Cn5-37 TaxID=2908886 RepID=UPI001F1BC86F|nr:DNA methyltransferase [Pseudoalteromonas sp. Cn5-37]MCF2918577.1 hypothetical protein [Pseudoalteromonas sp. Cn5-37]